MLMLSLRKTLTSLSPVDGAAALPAPKRPAVQMPDEYLPPNKILFLQNLPESVTKDQLLGLFSQCVMFPYVTMFTACLIQRSQISEFARSASHPDEEGHRVRGVHGRRERDGRKGCFTQLQAGRREQNQSMDCIFRLLDNADSASSADHVRQEVVVRRSVFHIYCLVVRLL